MPSLPRDCTRSSRDVKAIADAHLADLECCIAEVQAMADTRHTLAHCCAAADRPDCPLLARLDRG